VVLAQKQQDVCGLRDKQLSGLEERRRKGRKRLRRIAHHLQERLFAAAFRGGLARDIDIADAGFFKREPNEFAPPLNRGPVVKLVSHWRNPPNDARSASLQRA
jgi:hypothetical protein